MTYTESKEIRSISDELFKVYNTVSRGKDVNLKQISSTMINLAMQLHELIRISDLRRGMK